MAGITQAMCLSFKTDIFDGVHQPGDTYMIALYRSATATLDKNTTVYSATGEVVATGYVAGGMALAGRATALAGDVGYLSFTDPVWAAATIAAEGALIYNATRANKALCVVSFGGTVTSTNGNFTVDLPAAGAAALLRIN